MYKQTKQKLRKKFKIPKEYEIVFTVPKKYKLKIIQIAKTTKTPIIEIGFVTKGNGVFIEKNKKSVRLEDLGWHHFKK